MLVQKEYVDKIKLRNWFKSMMALAFVLLKENEDVYMHLLDEASELFDKSIFDKLEKWIDYFFNT